MKRGQTRLMIWRYHLMSTQMYIVFGSQLFVQAKQKSIRNYFKVINAMLPRVHDSSTGNDK